MPNRQIADRVLGIISPLVSVAGLPLIVASILASSPRPNTTFIALYLGAYALFPLIWLTRNRLSLTARTLIALIAIYFLATVLLLRLGLSGPGIYLLMALAVIATMLLGLRAGLIAAAAGAALLTTISVAVYAQWLSYPERVLHGSGATNAWLIGTLSFSLVSVVTVYGPGFLFAQLGRQRRKLQETNDRLQREIVERVEAEGESLRLHEQLLHAQKLEAIGRLSGGVAHEFNNLLVAMQANAAILAAESQGNESLHEPALEIGQACDRASALTRQLLAFSRKEPTKRCTVDFDELVVASQKLIAPLIEETITVHYEIDSHAHADLDARQLEQVLLNLVVNARDAVGPKGNIWIRTCARSVSGAEAVNGAITPTGDFVVLAVQDDGSGIDPHVAQRLFEPFFTTKPEGEGTGLGLSAVFGIVRSHGGFIEFDTEPDEGTTFRVFLPACEAPSEAPKVSRASAPKRGANERILLVEDDALVQKASRRVLGRLGYSIECTEDGSKAWELYQEDPLAFDLVISDVSMPGISGFELADRIRKARPEAKVLFVSGYVPDEGSNSQLSAPRTAFLAKPFDATTLGAAIRELLDNE